MRVHNKTIWRTEDLKPILNRLAQTEIYSAAKRKHITVNIVYGRHSGDSCSGCAYYHGSNMTVRVQKDALSKYDFVFVAAHEMAHLEGLHHIKMAGKFKDRSVATVIANWPWINGMEIRKREPKPKHLPLQEIRFVRAKKNLAIAQVRFKRAKTLLNKWSAKVKYYERQLWKAAAKPSPIPPSTDPTGGE